MDQLSSAVKSIDLNKEYLQAADMCSQLADEIRKLKHIYQSPLDVLFEIVSNYRNQVDLKREQLKYEIIMSDVNVSIEQRNEKIDEQADKLQKLIDEFEIDRQKFIESEEFKIKLFLVKTKLNLAESDQKMWRAELDELKEKNETGNQRTGINCCRIEELETIGNLARDLEKLLQPKKDSAMVQQIENFEKYGLNPPPLV